MNDSNDKMVRWEKLGLFCYYKLFMRLRKWYSVIWKWTWVHCKCLLQTLVKPLKGKQWIIVMLRKERKWSHIKISVSNPTAGHTHWGNQRERDTCTPMFIAALFILARTWKQPRCPSADEWIRKLWYIYIMEYYSAIKKNTLESVLMRWMKLEPIIQSEVNQKEKHQYSILTHIYGI